MKSFIETSAPSCAGKPADSNHSCSGDAGCTATKKRSQVRRACSACRRSKTGCSDIRPCPRCVLHGIADTCVDAPMKRRRRSKKLSADTPPKKVAKKSRKARRPSAPVQHETPVVTTYDEGAVPGSPELNNLYDHLFSSFVSSPEYTSSSPEMYGVEQPGDFSVESPEESCFLPVEVPSLVETTPPRPPMDSESLVTGDPLIPLPHAHGAFLQDFDPLVSEIIGLQQENMALLEKLELFNCVSPDQTQQYSPGYLSTECIPSELLC